MERLRADIREARQRLAWLLLVMRMAERMPCRQKTWCLLDKSLLEAENLLAGLRRHLREAGVKVGGEHGP